VATRRAAIHVSPAVRPDLHDVQALASRTSTHLQPLRVKRLNGPRAIPGGHRGDGPYRGRTMIPLGTSSITQQSADCHS
jgi:hypothetical protein